MLNVGCPRAGRDRSAVEERDDVAGVHVGVLEPHVRRRADEQADTAADLLRLVAREVPVEADARRELDGALRYVARAAAIGAVDGDVVRDVIQELRDVGAETERHRELRR